MEVLNFHTCLVFKSSTKSLLKFVVFVLLVYQELCYTPLHNDRICDLHYDVPACNFDGHDCKNLKQKGDE